MSDTFSVLAVLEHLRGLQPLFWKSCERVHINTPGRTHNSDFVANEGCRSGVWRLHLCWSSSPAVLVSPAEGEEPLVSPAKEEEEEHLVGQSEEEEEEHLLIKVTARSWSPEKRERWVNIALLGHMLEQVQWNWGKRYAGQNSELRHCGLCRCEYSI